MPGNDTVLELTTDIVTAMVTNNSVPAEQLPALINSVYATLSALGQEVQVEAAMDKPQGAVTSRKSLADPNVIISMIDGKTYRSLKRHIARQGYTPESYREAFGLKPDYPMVAPGYSARRSEIAKKLGLGRKSPVVIPPEQIPPDDARPKKVRRSRKAGVEQTAQNAVVE